MTSYKRYRIETKRAPNIVPHPCRFNVKVGKVGLAKLLLKEAFQYRGNKEVILSRPCVYGVFSGPLGGFAPQEEKCVGCLRCTTQYPEFVQILRNPKRAELGDHFFTADTVDTIVHEAETGHIPIRGMGYRGQFGGAGWDSMWTDMSEIVRPTRDGIHGREFISTEVDIGENPSYLQFDTQGRPIESACKTYSLPIPIFFDRLPHLLRFHPKANAILSEAARQLQTLAVIPYETIQELSLTGNHIIPLISFSELSHMKLSFEPKMIEMADWEPNLYKNLKAQFPSAQLLLRTDYNTHTIRSAYLAGIRVFHCVADYHGKGEDNRFVMDLIRDVHNEFVKAGCRDCVTLVGSGGIIAAEHLPKAIICGLDAVALNTPLLVALQAAFSGPCHDPNNSHFNLPRHIPLEWGVQRLKNLCGAWRDQLLEILGAMGLREVRRMRGEIGRAMFQKDLENDAFKGITGYASQ